MKRWTQKPALFYTPRVLSIILLLILGSLAVQAYQGVETFTTDQAPFVVYILPVFVLLLITIVSWKKARIGGTLFIGGGFFYAFMINEFSASAMAMVATPLILLGVLFHISQYYYEK